MVSILNRDRNVMEMQFNRADVNTQWGMWRRDPSIQRVMGSLARTMIDFFQEQSRPNNWFFFLCTGIGRILKDSINLWTLLTHLAPGFNIYFKAGLPWLYGPLSHELRVARRPKWRKRQTAVYPAHSKVGSKSLMLMKPSGGSQLGDSDNPFRRWSLEQ